MDLSMERQISNYIEKHPFTYWTTRKENRTSRGTKNSDWTNENVREIGLRELLHKFHQSFYEQGYLQDKKLNQVTIVCDFHTSNH